MTFQEIMAQDRMKVASPLGRRFFSAFYILCIFNNLINSLQITLCDIDLKYKVCVDV